MLTSLIWDNYFSTVEKYASFASFSEIEEDAPRMVVSEILKILYNPVLK